MTEREREIYLSKMVITVGFLTAVLCALSLL